MPSQTPPPQLTRTKVVATMGPATRDRETLGRMLDRGLDVCRLNFSHGERAQHAEMVAFIRELAAERGDDPITILGDLGGPKIRLNDCPPGILLAAGQTVRIARGDHDCSAAELTTNYPPFVDEVPVGHRVLIDDGAVRLLVIEHPNADTLLCSCTVGGPLSSHKGVNLPDTRLTVPALTEKDLSDLDWAVENNLDYVCLSFVRRPDDLRRLRAAIRDRRADLGVIVKIEKTEALEHLDELIAESDGVLVARGDLGVEMDIWQVPLVQKALTARCREAGVPVIIATQMLQSMVTNHMPTRAEVSDVANAILDAADAVMLSAETAVGHDPPHVVDIMNKVADVTESYMAGLPRKIEPAARPAAGSSPAAVTLAAAEAALELRARLVAAWTASGNTIRLLARHRLPMPVIGLTWDPRVARRINLMYGVMPIHMEPISEPERMFAALDQRLSDLRLVDPGDLIVIVASTRPSEPGGTNALMVHRVGDSSR